MVLHGTARDRTHAAPAGGGIEIPIYRDANLASKHLVQASESECLARPISKPRHDPDAVTLHRPGRHLVIGSASWPARALSGNAGPGASPDLTGDEATVAALRAVLTPELRSSIDARLGQRFGLRNWDTLIPGASERVLVKSRWPEDWRGLRLSTWLPLEASAPEIRAAIDALRAVREVLAKSPGMAARD